MESTILNIPAMIPATVMAEGRQVVLYIAIGATVIAVIQLILAIFGADADSDFDVDGDADFDVDADGGEGFLAGYLSVRNAVAFLAMFGWTALYCIEAGVGDPWAFLISGLVGVGFTLVLQAIFFLFTKMTVDSTAKPESAIGKIAEVYIPIPERGKGSGRVFVTLNESQRELTAVSSGPAFQRNARVRVTAIENGSLVVEAENAGSLSYLDDAAR